MKRCPKCGGQLMLKNDSLVCLWCPSKKQGVAKPGAVAAIDPGEAFFEKSKQAAVQEKGAVRGKAALALPVSVNNTAEAALDIMKSLPMPDDIKQFKQIKKIVDLIEKLIEVQSNDNGSISSS
jgi:hypothetical protein